LFKGDYRYLLIQENILSYPKYINSVADFSKHTKNLSLPIHRWFRFPAGFSAEWVTDLILSQKGETNDFTVFDPFAGSGTTVLCAETCGVAAIGIDAHPFLVRIAKAKLFWRSDVDRFKVTAKDILSTAKHLDTEVSEYPKLIQDCYSEESLLELHKLKFAWEKLGQNEPETELIWLALVSILRSTCQAKAGPWQYILPKQQRKNPIKPFAAFESRIELMCEDMQNFQRHFSETPHGVIENDSATSCVKVKKPIDLVVTSPPYPNNYDYADATRLETSFFGVTTKWADLQSTIRQYLIRSCSQHMAASEVLDTILDDPNLKPIIDELRTTCYSLQAARMKFSGKKHYDTMVAAYFSDLAKVWLALRSTCKKNATICFIVGDSAPYGVHIPVDKWLVALAQSMGFQSARFQKTRSRNEKWLLERKHKHPLCEGILWIN
jgi:DNA modification methylase